jgi:hypothetical protein
MLSPLHSEVVLKTEAVSLSLSGPENRSGRGGEDKKYFHCRKWNTGLPALSKVKFTDWATFSGMAEILEYMYVKSEGMYFKGDDMRT